MAPKRIQARKASQAEYAGRWRKALDRRAAMERELAAGGHDPALLLAIQGAIAAADALCIYQRGEQASSERREDALEVLARVEIPGVQDALKHFTRLLRAKGEIEYGAKCVKLREVQALADHARRFLEFVERHLPQLSR